MDEKQTTNEVAEEVVEATETADVTVNEPEEATTPEVARETAPAVPSMAEFENQINESLSRVSVGDIVECTVISCGEDEVIVNLGYMADGIIAKSELFLDQEEKIADRYPVETVLKAEVMSLNDGEGNVALSLKKAEQILVWDELENAFNEKTALTVTLKEVVKGGLVADIKGIRAFMPASMVSSAYVEDLSEYVGQTMQVLVKDFDLSDRKVILSHKEIDAKEKAAAKAEFMENLEKDQVYTGTVKKLMNFGAFVDIGGVDGLVHINEMSWKRIKHPSDVMKEGDVVEVVVLSVDKAQDRISLGLKNIGDNPWDKIEELYPSGKVFEGVVTRLTKFGAFVRIGDGIEGLVHISQIANERINHPTDVLKQDEKVNVKVLSADGKNQKISLSIKATLESAEDEEVVELNEYNSGEEATTSLESVFKNILKDLEK